VSGLSHTFWRRITLIEFCLCAKYDITALFQSHASRHNPLRFQILFLVWLGKFFVDYVWSIVQQSLAVGFKEAFGSWAVVDALNLVWLHAADGSILCFRNND
jgi:hypothetical protein